MSIDIKVEAQINDKEITEALKDILQTSMETMADTARRIVPVATGNLRDSINLEKIDDFNYVLSDGVGYGVHVEFGTEPHLIVPREKQALRFVIGDRVVFAKKVKHPGTNPQPFFRPALDDVRFMVMPRLFLEKFG